MIDLRVDASDIDRITTELDATRREAELSIRSAVRRATRWLNTRIRREVARGARVPQRVIRRRLVQGRIRERGGGWSVELFVGLNPIDLAELGVRQTRTGIRTRVGSVRSGFVAAPRGRTGAFRRRGRSRLPIERLSHPIEDVGRRATAQAVERNDFSSYLLDVYRRELLWRMSRRR